MTNLEKSADKQPAATDIIQETFYIFVTAAQNSYLIDTTCYSSNDIDNIQNREMLQVVLFMDTDNKIWFDGAVNITAT